MKESLIERLKASQLGRAEYRLKCLLKQWAAPLQRRRDRGYIQSIPQKVEALKHKERIRVLFFAMHPAYWRCDTLYRAMLQHPRFEPTILVCGGVEHGKASMLQDMERMEAFLQAQHYDYQKAFDPGTGEWLDIRTSCNPDIIFYTKPYEGVLPRAYRVEKFWDKLFCYIPYGLLLTNPPELVNTRMSQLMWMQFYENELVFDHSPVLRSNSRITGSTKCDEFQERLQAGPKDVWKPAGGKRIIWAPHHSIDGGSLGWSNFLDVADDFLDYARTMNGQAQFAFKPHPLLKRVLYEHPDWGPTRTDEYYKQWATLPNCQLEDGPYVDLFLTSDAMIHDCGSFMAEYLMTGNPVFYLAKPQHNSTLNGFGIRSFDMHYKGQTMTDIRHFVQQVVIDGHDPMQSQRHAFYHDYLLPPGGRTAAENMILEILKFSSQR